MESGIGWRPTGCSPWNLGLGGDQPVALPGILDAAETNRLLSVESGIRWRANNCSPWNLGFGGDQTIALRGIWDSAATNRLLSVGPEIRWRPTGSSPWNLGFGGDQSVAVPGIWDPVDSGQQWQLRPAGHIESVRVHVAMPPVPYWPDRRWLLAASPTTPRMVDLPVRKGGSV